MIIQVSRGLLLFSIPQWNGQSRQSTPQPTTARCALSKQGQRLLHQLTAVSGDTTATQRLIKKFVASSPKAVTLNALTHLLSPNTTHPRLPSLALTFYLKTTEASRFDWNPKLAAELIALLSKHGHFAESDVLINETISRLGSKERDLAAFYGNLINCHCKHKSDQGFDSSCARLRQLICGSSSVYVKRRGYESVIGGLCEMGRPREAEDLVGKMKMEGINPSGFEFRSLAYGYGKLGLFADMLRFVDRMDEEGVEIDTVCSNMVLSSYGAHNELSQMSIWLRMMKARGIPFSIRTYNTALNSCPTIMSLLKDLSSLPLCMGDLIAVLDDKEALLVKELPNSSIIDEIMEWSDKKVELDLHGMHLGSAYLILLQWMDDMRCRFSDATCVVPAEVAIITGLGKHSSIRGESMLKQLVKDLLVQMRCPLRIDRRNVGCFVARGRVLKEWLCAATASGVFYET